MKLRRSVAVAAATAVLTPLALLAAPAAYATESASSTTPSTNSSSGTSESETAPSNTDPEKPADDTAQNEKPENENNQGESSGNTTEKTEPGSLTDSEKKKEEAKQEQPKQEGEKEKDGPPADDEEEWTPDFCEVSKAEVTIEGLPGKIAAGSGWHKFSMKVVNTSESTLHDLNYFAAASADKNGEELFSAQQVRLEALNEETGKWELLAEGGESVGYVGWSEELKAEHEVEIPMRIKVAANAPVGSGFSLGASIYADFDSECQGVAEVAYKFQIVKGNTDTGGTKPQVGGKVPLPTKKPASTGSQTTAQLQGSLAATGSSDTLPTIGIVGGIAIVAGAGVVFAMRRRGSGNAAA
ncbi:hypothetical protein [Streptomyces sp. NPDC004726]